MSDLGFADFRRALRSEDADEVEMLWLELLEQEPLPAELARRVLEFMAEQEFAERACEFAEMLEEELLDAGRTVEARDLMRFHASLTPQDPRLKKRYADCMRALHGADNPAFERCLEAAGVTGDEPLTAAGERLEKFLTFAPGDVVSHGSWGLGLVSSVRPDRDSVVVDFRDRPGHRFALDMALRALRRMPPGSLEARFVREPEELRRQAEEDPAALVRQALESAGGSMELRELREKLTATALDADQWSAWWQRIRRLLVDDQFVELPGGGRSGLRLRREAVDPVAAALERARNETDPAERVDLARRLYDRVPDPGVYADSARQFSGELLEWARRCAPGRPGVAFCALDLARRAAAAADADVAGEAPELEPPEDVPGALRWLADMRVSGQVEAFLDWLEERGFASSEELLAAMLRSGPDVARDVAFKRLREQDREGLERALAGVADGAERLLPAFLWLCSRVAQGRVQPPPGRTCAGLYAALLQASNRLESGRLDVSGEERDSLSSSARSLLLDERFISRALREADAEECTRLCATARGLRSISDAVPAALRHHLAEERPDVVEAEARRRRAAHAILTTRRGLQKRRDELEKIVHEDIPRNRKELGEAARFGDLSENAEYEAAREEQFKLANRAKAIQEELEKAHVPSPEEIDADRVGFGTRVRAARSAENGGEEEEVVYDILGPWDSDPSGGVISYLAPIARGLEGAAAGDERAVEIGLRTVTFRIRQVELSPLIAGE